MAKLGNGTLHGTIKSESLRMPHTQKQRILCIAFPYLATDQIIRAKEKAARDKSSTFQRADNTPPIIVTDRIKNAIRIVALEEKAAKFNLCMGQSLSDAQALVPNLEQHQADYDKTHTLLLHIASWCERYTPLVALSHNPNEPFGDSLFLDITGCAHLFGGEQEMISDIKAKLTSQGFSVSLCIADTPGAAWAMAHYGNQQIIEKDKHIEAIEAFSLSALRIADKSVIALSRVGLKTIGCIANLPRAPLAARFGSNLLRKLDQTLGREEETISPIRPIAELVSERRFNDPIVYQDDIKKIIHALAENLIPLLEKHGIGIRECGLKLFRVDGKVSYLNVHSAKPLRDAKQIARLFYERLAGLHDDLDLGFGFDLIRLEVVRSDPFNIQQTDLIETNDSNDNYDDLVNRLGARLGTNRVQQFTHTNTHIPERAYGYANISRNTSGNNALAFDETPHIITRPIILFNKPERIETIAQIPDGPPMRFRWRKVYYDVAKTEGPERIACEWWKDGRATKTRDYFRIEDKQGYRFWLFRHGLYERETNHPDWYMHGIFA